MERGFSLRQRVAGRETFLRRMVCEIRYTDGHLYLDRSGRLLRSLLRDSPELVLAPEPTAQGTTLHNILNSVQLGFSLSSARLTLDKTSTDDVIEEAEATGFVAAIKGPLQVVFDELEVESFSRVGFREQYHVPFETKEECDAWPNEIGLASLSPTFVQSFAGGQDRKPEAFTFSFTVEGEDCHYRVGLDLVERSAQLPAGDAVLTIRATAVKENQKRVLRDALKRIRQRQVNSAFAAVIDIDAFLVEPSAVDIADFVQERHASNLDKVIAGLPKKGK